MNVISKFLVGFIILWQKTLSPDKGFFRFIYCSPIFSIFTGARPGCRFYPSCSEYAMRSLENEKLYKAILMSTKRVLSCHSFKPKNNG